VLESLQSLIPQQVEPRFLLYPNTFKRRRKLPYAKLLTTILSLCASGKTSGVQTKIDEIFRHATRNGLWNDCDGIHRSALTKARAHVSWTAFENLYHKTVQLAQTFPSDEKFLWHSMPIHAIDGSKYTLPATDKLRSEFDPDSGFEHKGKGHFPQCLVTTAVDVLQHMPIARTIAPVNTSERAQAALILPMLPPGGVNLYDRGYPSYDYIVEHQRIYTGFFLFRCPAQSTFAAVQRFVQSKKEEDTIYIFPSGRMKKSLHIKEMLDRKTIKLRVIKLLAPDGTLSVLLTNLHSRQRFPREEIIDLYFRRWAVETYYRDEKESMQIETFHSKTPNGIRQELYASVTMTVITHVVSMIATQNDPENADARPQFKNALVTIAREAAILTSTNPVVALSIFEEILRAIARIRYYRPKKRRPTRPRVCKQPPKKWTFFRKEKLAHA
jgi:hypothetical protein